LEEDKNICLFI